MSCHLRAMPMLVIFKSRKEDQDQPEGENQSGDSSVKKAMLLGFRNIVNEVRNGICMQRVEGRMPWPLYQLKDRYKGAAPVLWRRTSRCKLMLQSIARHQRKSAKCATDYTPCCRQGWVRRHLSSQFAIQMQHHHKHRGRFSAVRQRPVGGRAFLPQQLAAAVSLFISEAPKRSHRPGNQNNTRQYASWPTLGRRHGACQLFSRACSHRGTLGDASL